MNVPDDDYHSPSLIFLFPFPSLKKYKLNISIEFYHNLIIKKSMFLLNEKLNLKNGQIYAKISMKNIDFRRKMHEN